MKLRHRKYSCGEKNSRQAGANAERALLAGLELRKWWEHADSSNSYAERFELIRVFNDPDVSFGFFDTAQVAGRKIKIMGEVEDRLFDRRASGNVSGIRNELREFVLKYLMRISDFRQPTAYSEVNQRNNPEWLQARSWCSNEEVLRTGFGYTQLLFKLREKGEIAHFPAQKHFEIVDLRQLKSHYEWLVLSVRIFDFTISLSPLGNNSLRFTLPLEESSHIVLSSEFICDRNDAQIDANGRIIIGQYGFGYAFLKSSEEELLSYGPGQFDVAFQQFVFRIYEDGEVRVKLVFVANRPKSVTSVPLAPFDWAACFAKIASLGFTSRLIDEVRPVFRQFPLHFGSFDPILTGVNLVNLFTGNQAAKRLCISREQLEKTFLVKHFDQHYQMINGALQTWRGVSDWTNESALPEWVKSGCSS